jgi:glycosyltransferase involved in cell wall biosynthesis
MTGDPIRASTAGSSRERVGSRARPSVVLSSEYPEGAILAIARAAARRSELVRFFTTFYSPKWRPAAARVPFQPVRSWLDRRLSRRFFAGVETERVETVAQLPQLAHVLLTRMPASRGLTTQAMYWVKDRLDRGVAARLEREDARATVAIYGGAAETLRRTRELGRAAVLHFVNSHPAYHNRFLREMAGLRPGHHEMIPPAVAERVEREIDASHRILAPSEFIARQLRATGASGASVVVEPYGVDLSAFRPRESVDEAGRDRRVRCLFIGQISHRKGIRVLVDAARTLAREPIDFRLVGPMVSPEVLAGAPENVSWSPTMDHRGAAEEMRAADLFVLPSIEDAYALVVLEAMASGLPVVVSENTGSRELVTPDANGLLVEAGDARALADAIARLSASPELRSRLGAQARRGVAARQSWDDYGDRVLAHIAGAVAELDGAPANALDDAEETA